ncbi:hypothetical protein SEA_PEGGYLEG03_51 [Arthrobacter phage PeggyLeg03]|nr:hypothetical protein SEA_PEGGYLEG03_51 [Arthrobacter phage PeggyLeg03]
MAPNYDPITNLTAPDTEAATVASLGRQTAAPTELKPGTVYLVAHGDGGVRQIDTDDFAPRPRRKADTHVNVSDAASLEAYLDKHGIGFETEIHASATEAWFNVIINAGTVDQAGWGDHSVRLNLKASDEWKKWTGKSGVLMNQTDFAEFIEDNAQNIVEPSSAEILEIAQSLQVKRGVDFESGTRLSDGNVQFGYRETTNATAGAAGQLSIPATISIALRPFDGGEAYKVTAHFRYRLQGSQLALGFKLQEAAKIREDAFKEVAGGIRAYAEENDYLYLTNQ